MENTVTNMLAVEAFMRAKAFKMRNVWASKLVLDWDFSTGQTTTDQNGVIWKAARNVAAGFADR